MAIIKLGPIVSAISGKVSGNIFSHNKGGPYVKGWVIPTNPQTVRQQAWRSGFSSISSDWRGLSNSEREGWAASALLRPITNRLGEKRFLSGYGLYMKQNMALQAGPGGLLSVAPVPLAVPSYTIQSTSWNIGASGDFAIELLRTDGPDALATIDEYLVLSVSLPTRDGVKPTIARHLVSVNSASIGVVIIGTTLHVTILNAEMELVTGPVTSGNQILVGAAPLNNLDPWPVVKQTSLINITF